MDADVRFDGSGRTGRSDSPITQDPGAVVRGEVRFPAEAPPLSAATVRVSLQDVSLADAPARVVAEQTLRDVSHPGGRAGGIRFELRLQQVEARTRYVVRVHVDVDNDGRVSYGDYVSTQSHPVLTFGHPDHVDVPVRRVGGA